MHTRFAISIQLIAVMIYGAACNNAVPDTPTQTPHYVVVTDTPTPTGNNPPATLPPAPTDLFPTPFSCQAEIIEQEFENGRMFWVGTTLDERCRGNHNYEPGSGEIWILIDANDSTEGEWVAVSDTWDESVEPEALDNLTPPAGTTQPVRGFGKAWREGLTDEQRERLGWAASIEVRFFTDYRYDPGGFINIEGDYVARPGQHVLVTFAGNRFFLDEQTGLFESILTN